MLWNKWTEYSGTGGRFQRNTHITDRALNLDFIAPSLFSLREPVESGLWEDHAQPPAPFPDGSRFSRLLISINQKEIKTLFSKIIKDFFKFGLFLYFFNLFIYLYFLKVY
jgi:hypothetical protein